MQRYQTVEIFRERLVQVIRRSDLSRSAFARKVGIDRSTLSQILSASTDRLPRVETLAAIATSEQVSLDWLIGVSQEEAPLRTDLVPALELAPAASSPSDEYLQKWHAEAIGYKIRHVPAVLPDLLKSEEVLEYEYQLATVASPERRLEVARSDIAYQRRPETDTEVCCSVSDVEAFAGGTGPWSGLPEAARRRGLAHMMRLLDELYPTYRLFLYDTFTRYSVPLTIFGPLRAVIYIGQAYLVLNSADHIRALTAHFDDLIRVAVVQPVEVARFLDDLLAQF